MERRKKIRDTTCWERSTALSVGEANNIEKMRTLWKATIDEHVDTCNKIDAMITSHNTTTTTTTKKEASDNFVDGDDIVGGQLYQIWCCCRSAPKGKQ